MPAATGSICPVENIDLLSRYGSEDTDAQLDRLGGVGWQQRRARMKKRIREMADQLIKVAAARMLRKAPVMTPPEGLYDEFCARFPYEETDDQLAAIEAVLDDLALGPANGPAGLRRCRLRQDRGRASRRLRRGADRPSGGGRRADDACWPASMPRPSPSASRSSRCGSATPRGLSPPRNLRRVKTGLADGTVDIVIGTHALLGKGIEFKDLGLLIVDEEQHFGVRHKERLKELRADVHVLTLIGDADPAHACSWR